MRCPCCGADTLAGDWHYDAATGVVTTARGSVRVRGWKRRRILEALSKARKRPLTKGLLIEHVYQMEDEPENAENGISATLCQLRAQIASTGLTVRSDGPGRGAAGYWLEMAREAAE